MHLDLLRYLVGDLRSDGLKIEVDPEKKTVVKDYLKEKGVGADDLLVGMHIGGRGRKRWEIGNFQKLADWITSVFPAKVIFLWGPEEREIIQKIFAKDKDQIVADLFSLPVLSALIQRCNLFISPDTGAMHLSVAVGTPTLALFLDSDPIKYGPQGKIHRVMEVTNEAVSVERVKNVVEEMVKSLSLVPT